MRIYFLNIVMTTLLDQVEVIVYFPYLRDLIKHPEIVDNPSLQ